MFILVSNYNTSLEWLDDYTENYFVYDRSDTKEFVDKLPRHKYKRVDNIGWDIYDKLTFIIENYDHLPPVALYTKGNIFKYISKEEFDAIAFNNSFTPILTQHHNTDGDINFYLDGMYYERNNSWYLLPHPAKHFKSYNEFAREMGLPTPNYLPFAPGSNYIVPRENILKHSKAFYEKLRSYVDYSQTPGEAQIIERALYTIWK